MIVGNGLFFQMQGLVLPPERCMAGAADGQNRDDEGLLLLRPAGGGYIDQ
jgi:hypothetical protein